MEKYLEKLDAYVKRASEKVAEIRCDDSLVFPLFTDLHTKDADHEFMTRLIPAIKLVTENIRCDAVLDLGDNFDMLGRQIHISNSELKARFESVFEAIYEASGKLPLINVNGNHDAIGTDFFKPDFWNDITKGKYGNTSAVYGNEGSYYYVDYVKANTRLVVLSLPYDSDIEAEMPTPLWGFGKKQLEWLENNALDTSMDVIILSHVPFYSKYTGDMESTLGVWDGENAKLSYIANLCGWIDDLDDAVKIIEEFDKREGSRLVGVLSGHTHGDSTRKPYEEIKGKKNPLPCYQFVTGTACLPQTDCPDLCVRLDVAVWTPSKGEFTLVRVGDGEDRGIII